MHLLYALDPDPDLDLDLDLDPCSSSWDLLIKLKDTFKLNPKQRPARGPDQRNGRGAPRLHTGSHCAFRYNTAVPVNGALNSRLPSGASIRPSRAAAPFAVSNHSNRYTPALRSTEKDSPGLG